MLNVVLFVSWRGEVKVTGNCPSELDIVWYFSDVWTEVFCKALDAWLLAVIPKVVASLDNFVCFFMTLLLVRWERMI